MEAICARILVIDGDAALRELLRSLLEHEGYQARAVSSSAQALERAAAEEFDAVLAEAALLRGAAAQWLDALRKLQPDVSVVLMAASAAPADYPIEALRAGGFDCVAKPLRRGPLLAALSRALERRALEQENRRLRRALDQTRSLGELIGTSPPLRELFALIRRLAHSSAHALITGERGTGKSAVARALHFGGVRAQRPFVPLECGGLHGELLEQALFGLAQAPGAELQAPGAELQAPGAEPQERGAFDEAQGGTLFLREVDALELPAQDRLLRALEEREAAPLGNNRPPRAEVRVIGSAQRNLAPLVAAGRFRAALLERLSAIRIQIPPLRERPEDIPLLAQHFAQRHAGEQTRSISDRALEQLAALPWPGNAAELEQVVSGALARTSVAELGPADFALDEPRDVRESGFEESLLRAAVNRRMTLRELGDRYIEEILRLTRGNKVQAARVLGINRRTLYRRGLADGPSAEHTQ